MKVYHADHGVTAATMAWALSQFVPAGFFLRTFELPADHVDLLNGLYGPASGDAPIPETDTVYVKRSEDRPASRMVNLPKRPTRLMTIIGMEKDGEVTIFTAYGGPAAEREPNDPTLTPGTPEHQAAVDFWATHALASL